MEPFNIGDIIEVVVTGIEPYGIFIKADNDYTGLIHISEIDNSYIKDINDYVNVGEYIYANVIGIDDNNKHLNLSIKNMNYSNNLDKKVKESVSGFLPLHNQLDSWIDETINKMNNN